MRNITISKSVCTELFTKELSFQLLGQFTILPKKVAMKIIWD